MCVCVDGWVVFYLAACELPLALAALPAGRSRDQTAIEAGGLVGGWVSFVEAIHIYPSRASLSSLRLTNTHPPTHAKAYKKHVTKADKEFLFYTC